MNPYLVTKHSWGRTWERIEYEPTLKKAKDRHGWTRELHTSYTVRRARVADVERVNGRRGDTA